MKMTGCTWEILERTSQGYQLLFCGRGLKLFSPLRGANSKSTHYLLSYYRGGPFGAEHLQS